MKDIPERREDGNWIRNIKFRFPLPILRDGKEVVRVDGISLDKEQPDEHTVTLEKFPTLETVVLLSQLKQKPDDYINLRVATRRMDCLQGNSTTAATDLELVLSPNLPKNEDSRQP